MPWSLELIEKYKDKWSWGSLSNNKTFNKALPWSLELIERFEDCWSWGELSANEALPWSLELIEKYKDKWSWDDLCTTALACLPKLSIQDIDEVMSHHFPLTQISKQSNDFDDDLPF